MKKLVLVLFGIGVTASAAIVAMKWQSHPVCLREPASPPVVSAPPSSTDSADLKTPAPPANFAASEAAAKSVNAPLAAASSANAPAPVVVKPSAVAGFSQPLQTLVSPQASYVQKQAAWKELQDTHQLDKAITDLEHASAADPSVAEYSAALGEAYVRKLRTLDDFRKQSILAIKADQTFDQALNLDSSHWEARFWKATSLSYWPDALNKSPEVIDNLVTLVEQQESRLPQPHYAQTYVLLGEQYLKVGYTDDAKAVWQRGASRFPGDDALRQKLVGLQ